MNRPAATPFDAENGKKSANIAPEEPTASPQPIFKNGAGGPKSFARAANWTVGLAAATLVLVSVGGYFYHREKLGAIAAEHLRLVVTGPSVVQSGVASEYLISATAIDGRAVPAQIEVALLSPDGRRLKSYKEPADERGRMKVAIPADLKLPAEARLLVVARHHDSREEAETTLAVESARYDVQLALDRPFYRPGDTLDYRALVLSRFSLTTDRDVPLHFEILDPAGAVVAGSVFDATTARGAAGGEFKIPDGLADGRYALVVRGINPTIAERRRTFNIRRRREPSETQAKTIPLNPAKIDVAFFPEGGRLATGLESRVYFTARDSLGNPVHLVGEVLAIRDKEDGDGKAVAKVETTFEGRGAFNFAPQANTTYRLKITSPAGAKNEPVLPKVSTDGNVVLNAGSGVFEAGAPLEFNIRAAKAGIPLVVAAHCRGVQVGQQPLVTRGANGEGNPVAIALDPAVGGVVRLTVFDYSAAPPRPVAERLVYRRPSQWLNVRTLEDGRAYAPGEKVSLTFQVTDETGRPVPAALAVAVVDDALLKRADERTQAMPTQFLLTNEIEKPEDLEDADFYLSDLAKNKVSAATALDLLLGAQDLRRLSEPPPFVHDNIDQIRDNYQKCLDDYQADRTPALNTLTAVSFVGGLGLVLLVVMLGLMRICSGMHLWVPAVGATTCCLIVGAILMDPGRLTPGQDMAVAFTSNDVPAGKTEVVAAEPPSPMESDAIKPAEQPGVANPDRAGALVPKYAHRHVAGKPGEQTDMAETLYWNPMLIADKDGKATIHFDLSDAATTFRVFIDAYGEGRLGANRTAIESRIRLPIEPKRPSETRGTAKSR